MALVASRVSLFFVRDPFACPRRLKVKSRILGMHAPSTSDIFCDISDNLYAWECAPSRAGRIRQMDQLRRASARTRVRTHTPPYIQYHRDAILKISPNMTYLRTLYVLSYCSARMWFRRLRIIFLKTSTGLRNNSPKRFPSNSAYLREMISVVVCACMRVYARVHVWVCTA